MMAQPNEPTVAAENTPPRDPIATPLTANGLENESENPDEWEYEYSTTETETYYVTLDLSATDPDQRFANESKKSFRPRWVNPASEYTMRRVKRRPKSNSQAPRPNAPNINDDTPDTQEEQDPGSSEVQILGLHTKNPIVSYNGAVYSCQWASNLGTELLFTEHDPGSTLPVLRTLPGNADLLAASSCRLISNSVSLEPKLRVVEQQPKKKRRTANGKDPDLIIPVGEQASEKRKGQARFLQRLMEVKESKGERDEVTVYTEKRLSRSGWNDYLAEKRGKERKKLLKVVGAGKDGESVEKARERLVELDREDERVREVAERWLAESHIKGKGRARNVFVRRGRPRKYVNEVEAGSVDLGTPNAESVSMGTPQRLDMEEDGEREQRDEDVEDYEREDGEDMEEGMGYDEDDYGEEDADGEDEDTQAAYGWS